MASYTPPLFPVLLFLVSAPLLLRSATVVEDLANLVPPKDFNATIQKNCLHNPSLRYCNSSADLTEIFRFTIVASHLCNESRNPNCAESFPKIDLHARPNAAALYISFSFFWKYCPLSVLTINLSSNSLKGHFPSEVFSCTQIQSLDLSNNELSGDLPVQNFSILTNLTHLNLSHNRFSEIAIPDMKLFLKRFHHSSFVHSGLLPNHQRYTVKILILLIAFPVAVILATCIIGCLCFRRPDYLPSFLRRNHKFTPAMLRTATEGFSEENLVAQNKGIVLYKGLLRDGTETRIEIYKDELSHEKRGEFTEECKVLVRLRHKNVVRVLGWCDNRKLRAVVTQWVDGDNVETWLRSSGPSWRHRLRVAIRVVEGMCYLRNHWPEVLYDLRTSSILLSGNKEPLISRFKVRHQTNISTNIYRFGLFLLEMITNLRPDEDIEGAEHGFTEYIRVHYAGNLLRVIDERMKLTGPTFTQARQGIDLGLMCTDLVASKQPSLDHIYDTLLSLYESCLNHRKHDEGRGH